jgi:DNA gyrase subunit A
LEFFPLLLANGGTGIPPHNLREVTAGTLAYLDDRQLTRAALMAHIAGPDFPTGAVLTNTADLPNIYESGRGRLLLRARADIEHGKDCARLVVTELPIGVHKFGACGVLAQIARRALSGALTGIGDVIEGPAGSPGFTVVLSAGVDPGEMLERLWQETALEISLPVELGARVNGAPRRMGLLEVVAEWVDSRLRANSADSVRETLLAVEERYGDERRTTLASQG